ncbi:hypothetical protein HYX14_04875 [Candidatus Woesearchaeota archaeon]|nr:hypothetical protein [Candidatus Woesearchaeota archaeon]
MTTKILVALDEYDKSRFQPHKDLGIIVEKIIPLGRPFCIDIGCPRDTLPTYWWVFGKESHILNELLQRNLPPEANAYSYSEFSIRLNDCGQSSYLDSESKSDHHIVAVQLYRLE